MKTNVFRFLLLLAAVFSLFSCKNNEKTLSFNMNKVSTDRYIYQNQFASDNSNNQSFGFSLNTEGEYTVHVVLNRSSVDLFFELVETRFFGISEKKYLCKTVNEEQCAVILKLSGSGNYKINVINKGTTRDLSYNLFTGIDSRTPVEF